MPLYYVEVPWIEDELIEAASAEEAVTIALDAADHRRCPRLTTPASLGLGKVVAEPAARRNEELVAAGLLKTANQVCEHCKVNAHKTMWGPGYVRCPRCGRAPLSPADRAAAEEAEYAWLERFGG